MMSRRRILRLGLPLLGISLILHRAKADALAQEEPLHTRIDALVVAVAPASDAEFLRRVSLDLNGLPPTADEVRAFLADSSPNKREAAIDRLLDGPLFARRMCEMLDVMLMERRTGSYVPQDVWMAYLMESARANKPWNQLAREILSADGTDDDPRAAVRFYLDRGSEPNLLTRDVGRIFFGRDLQCAQCHDHPLIDDYLQADYHGLFAFLAPGYELKIKEGEAEKTYYAERAGSDVQFESVFVKGTRHLTGARLFGDSEVVEPVYLPGEDYDVRPAENVRPVPKFSRRAQLAALATSGTNAAFNENMANRLWAEMMGRGLVHPVDLHHSGNPPTHPALMTLLGQQFAASGYDMRGFIRELALTQVYQRALDTPSDLLERSAAAVALVTELEQQREQLVAASESAMSSFNAAVEAWNAAQQQLLPAVAELDVHRGKFAEAVKKVDEAQAQVVAAQAQIAAKQSQLAAVTEASTTAQTAVAAVPGDAELAAAAQKFAERAAQFTAEMTALEAAVAEKTAAVAAPMSERDALRPAVETAQANVDPLRAAVRQQDASVLAARRQMEAAVVALNELDERLQTARNLAAVRATEETAAVAVQVIAVRQTDMQAATTQNTEYAAVVTQRQTELTAAQQAQSAADTVLAAIQQEHAVQAETVQTVATALAGTNAAVQKLPDDAALKSAADTLATRSADLAAALAEHQKQVDAAAAAQQAAVSAMAAAQSALDAASAEQTRRNEAVAAAQTALADAQSQADASRAAAQTARLSLIERWSDDLTLAALQPLSPEQLCWSVFRITGVYDRYWQQYANELQSAVPLSETDLQDPAKRAARDIEIEQKTYDALKGNVAVFVSVYGAGAGQPQTDFFATADQALFAANGGSIMSWVAPTGGNISERMANEADNQKAAEDLYVTLFSRLPTGEEAADVANYLAGRPDQRAAAAQELVWGLLASAEFRFNH